MNKISIFPMDQGKNDLQAFRQGHFKLYLLLFVSLTGCLPVVSQEPFYSDKDALSLDAFPANKLLGTWKEKRGGEFVFFTFKQRDQTSMELFIEGGAPDEAAEMRFLVHVFGSGQERFSFLDLYLLDAKPALLKKKFTGGHMLVFFWFYGEELREVTLTMLNGVIFREELNLGKIDLASEIIKHSDRFAEGEGVGHELEQTVLTATTDKLRAFVSGYLATTLENMNHYFTGTQWQLERTDDLGETGP